MNIPPPRMSRYRSVRRAVQAEGAQGTAEQQYPANGDPSTQDADIPPVPPVPLVPPEQFITGDHGATGANNAPSHTSSQNSLSRSKSMSRYHNRPSTRSAKESTSPQQVQQYPQLNGHSMREQRSSPQFATVSRSKSVDASKERAHSHSARTMANAPPLPNPPPLAIAPNNMYTQIPAHVAPQPYMGNRPQQRTQQQPSYGTTLYQQLEQRPFTSHYQPTSPVYDYAVAMEPEAEARELLEQETARQERMRWQQEEVHMARLQREKQKRARELAEERHRDAELRKAEKEAAIRRAEEEERKQKRRAWEKAEEERAMMDEYAKQLKREPELHKPTTRLQKQSTGTKASSSDGARSPNSPNDSVMTSPRIKEKEGEREKLSLFKRWRAEDAPTPAPSEERRPKTGGHAEQRPKTSGAEAIRDNHQGNAPITKLTPSTIAPHVDAPVSAVNHGDRLVRIIFKSDSILLPVKPTTTPLQLIRTAVTFLKTPVDPRNSMVRENFTKLGLKRTLRMYEHVRDILNSWESDNQHELCIHSFDSKSDTRLYSAFAPTIRPTGGSWWMSFSQKRGKWDKRFISLNSDGQITAAKNDQGKDTANVCNISDFEIFELDKEVEKKKIRPPKKYCYAIKSMQKSTMFLGDTGFVHFFATADESVAGEFWDAVFRWRSWYRVSTLGEGATSSSSNMLGGSSSAPLVARSGSANHKRNSSQQTKYVLGSFNTGLEFDPSSFRVSDDAKPTIRHQRLPSDVPLAEIVNVPKGENGLPSAVEHSKALYERRMEIRKVVTKAPPPLAFNSVRNQSVLEPDQRSPGLSPSTQGSTGLQRSSSTKSKSGRPSLDLDSSTGSNGPGRPRKDTVSSVKSPLFPTPLIDLTPQYVPPPQHNRKGKGFKPTNHLPGGLVDAATGPELMPGAIVLPDAREWRSKAVTGLASPSGTLLGRSGSVQSTNTGMPAGSTRGTGGRGLLGSLGGDEGFTGKGLLGERMKQAGS